MNGKERIMTALEVGQPDLVPIWEMAYNEPSIIGIARHFVAVHLQGIVGQGLQRCGMYLRGGIWR